MRKTIRNFKTFSPLSSANMHINCRGRYYPRTDDKVRVMAHNVSNLLLYNLVIDLKVLFLLHYSGGVVSL